MEHLSPKWIVLDNGSSALRAGFSGEDGPRCVLPAVVGRPTESALKSIRCCFRRLPDSYVGEEAQTNRDLLTLNYPVEGGIVTNWEDMQLLWMDAVRRLNVQADQHSVLISQPYLKRKPNRRPLVETMFESVGVGALQTALSALLTAYACGRQRALVVECGEAVCAAVPVHESQPIETAIERFPLAGRHVTDYLAKSLYQRGYYFDHFHDRHTVDDIKHSLCSVALDFAKDIKDIASTSRFLEKPYKLPDGQLVKVGSERFLSPEVLFEPTHAGVDQLGIHQTIYDAVMRCDSSERPELLANIVLSGGSTLFPGFDERLRTEIGSLLPAHTTVNVIARPQRLLLTWIGGSILSSLTIVSQNCITKREYEESGSSVVYRKNM